ncbi:Retrovirus-related Pol polyprotein from [Carex littledalei]|uniref:Retrovirus-related Pol polyprotein from n=1 Tax=Carex littledalei TaxID=544730 RepID=A0A833RIJ9_9POAL|nr:Retrovirus-related Pol polyprotein from [Carex littledalei]
MFSIRVVLGLAASLNLEIEKLDVKTAFLHGNLEEELYMEQPEEFVENDKEDMVCKLRRSFYGLKKRYETGNDANEIGALKEKLGNEFAMKNLSYAKQILGMKITRDRKRYEL